MRLAAAGSSFRFGRRDFIIDAFAGGAAANVAILIPVALTGGDGEDELAVV